MIVKFFNFRKFSSLYVTKLCLILFFLISINACGSDRIPLKILAGDTGALRGKFSVEIADEPQERTLGLMYRKTLGANHGMIFIFPYLVDGPFWMKNTLIPLDILFISEDKKIHTIDANAVPQTTTPRESLDSYKYVLEIAGGRAQALGIKVGDKVEFQAKETQQ